MNLRNVRMENFSRPAVIVAALSAFCLNGAAFGAGAVEQLDRATRPVAIVEPVDILAQLAAPAAAMFTRDNPVDRGDDPFQLPQIDHRKQINSKVVIIRDYADTFTPRAYDSRGMRIEHTFGNHEIYWHGSPMLIGSDPDRGPVGQVPLNGSPVMIGFPYHMRQDVEVQIDARQTMGFVAIAVGSAEAVGNAEHPSSLSVRFYPAGSSKQITVYNSGVGEIDTGLKSTFKVGDWHNYAVRFDLGHRNLEVFLDESFIGRVDLRTLGKQDEDEGDSEAASLSPAEAYAASLVDSHRCARGGDGNGAPNFSNFQPHIGCIGIGGEGEGSLIIDGFQCGAAYELPFLPNLQNPHAEHDLFGFGAGVGGEGGPGNPTNGPPEGPPVDPVPGPEVPLPPALPAGVVLMGMWWMFKRRIVAHS